MSRFCVQKRKFNFRERRSKSSLKHYCCRRKGPFRLVSYSPTSHAMLKREGMLCMERVSPGFLFGVENRRSPCSQGSFQGVRSSHNVMGQQTEVPGINISLPLLLTWPVLAKRYLRVVFSFLIAKWCSGPKWDVHRSRESLG